MQSLHSGNDVSGDSFGLPGGITAVFQENINNCISVYAVKY